jgi:hypothetical protein
MRAIGEVAPGHDVEVLPVARVFHFSPTDVERLVLHPDRPTKHIHHKANSIGSGHASEDHAFLQAVAQSIADVGALLVTGPANAKTELVKHISQYDPKLMKIIVVWKPSIIQATRSSSPTPDNTSRPRIGCCRRRPKRATWARIAPIP